MPISMRAAVLAGMLALGGHRAAAAPLSLDEAVTKAAEAAPLLRAGEAAVDAARAGRTQAGVRPNPSLVLEGENFVGTGPYNVFGQAEVTAAYSQPIERGGKRAARLAYADRDIGVAEAAARVARLDLAASVQRAYLDAIVASHALGIAESRLTVESEMQREALRRVRGYKDPLFVETRAAARVAQARIGLAEARIRSETARAALAAFWGGDGREIAVAGDVTASSALAGQLATADAALADAEAKRASAAVTVEQTRGVQDYTVSGGARFLRGTDDVAAVAGITIPLGRFDRNQGNIERARAERQRIELTAEAARLERLRRLASLGADIEAARTRARALIGEVYPQAAKALAQVRVGYARGGFNFRDMQDAADALLAAQDDWLDAISRIRDLQTDIDRLSGRFDAPTTGTRP